MMSQAYIDDVSRQAAEAAAKEGKRPFMVWASDIKTWKEQSASGGLGDFPFPFIGDYVPMGLKKEGEEFMVDSSGMGFDDEPALTIHQFIDKLEANKAYAIVAVGQFQVVMQTYVEVD